jgi:hypothetical protein
MKHRSHRRGKLTKLLDNHAFDIVKVLLVIGAICFAAMMTYLISRFG